MIPAGGGRIVNVASIAGLKGGRIKDALPTIAYNTTKGGAGELHPRAGGGMGVLQHPRQRHRPRLLPQQDDARDLDQHGEEITARSPLGRIGGPEDLKGVAVLLASRASDFITGQIIAVDGGVTAT